MGLFDDAGEGVPEAIEAPEKRGLRPQSPPKLKAVKKEASSLDRLRNLDEKIAGAIEKVRTLKEEKSALLHRIDELETALREKDEIISMLSAEKTAVKSQIEDLLGELDTLGVE